MNYIFPVWFIGYLEDHMKLQVMSIISKAAPSMKDHIFEVNKQGIHVFQYDFQNRWQRNQRQINKYLLM